MSKFPLVNGWPRLLCHKFSTHPRILNSSKNSQLIQGLHLATNACPATPSSTHRPLCKERIKGTEKPESQWSAFDRGPWQFAVFDNRVQGLALTTKVSSPCSTTISAVTAICCPSSILSSPSSSTATTSHIRTLLQAQYQGTNPVPNHEEAQHFPPTHIFTPPLPHPHPSSPQRPPSYAH